MQFEKKIEIAYADNKAVDALSDSTELSKKIIKQVMAKGAVWLKRGQKTQRIRRADKVLNAGDSLYIYYNSEVLDKQPDNAVLIADEGVYSIWYKPYGMLSQGSKWGDHCTINRWVEQNLQPQRPAFVVHRLDRAATGLIIIAHQKKTAAYFSSLFQSREIEKKYRALVWGNFPEYKMCDADIDDKPARSHVSLLKYDTANNQSLVEVSIETGRKHQIRKHLSVAGFPIVGDRLYGDSNALDDKDLCLTSCYLSFIPPLEAIKKNYTLPVEKLPANHWLINISR